MKICFLTLTGGTHVLEISPGITVKSVKEFLFAQNIAMSTNCTLFANGQNLTDEMILDEVVAPNSQVIITDHQEKTKKYDSSKQKQKQKQKYFSDSEFEEDEEDIPEYSTSESSSTETTDEYDIDNFDDMVVDDIKIPIKKKRRPRTKPNDPDDFESLVLELVDIGFDVSSAKSALRKNEYSVDRAATFLFSKGNHNYREEEEDEEEEDGQEYDSESGEIKKVHRFTMKRRDTLGDLKPIYQELTKEEQEAISDLVKETKQSRTTVLQVFIACDKDKETAFVCLTAP